MLRLLYIAPLALLLAFAAAYVQREMAYQAWLAAAYASAQGAASAGDLVAARDQFGELAGYRDADERAREMKILLEPIEARYVEGLQAIEHGEYERAVDLLTSVAESAPTLEDVEYRLDDARRLFGQELRRAADEAETARDWAAAEQTLRKLIGLNPTEEIARTRLATLQRQHGPLIVGNKRALWLVAPDGSPDRQLTDALEVIWPAWSPDRSRIAFLAPDPDDPVGNVSLYTIGLDGSEPQHLANGVSAHAAPAWSPDGERIAYTSFAGYDPIYETGAISVRVVDVTTGQETDLTGDEFSLAFNPSWSPDGKELAFVVKHQGTDERPQHSPGDVIVVHGDRPGFENLTNGAVRYVWSVTWSPRGDELLLFSLFGQTWYEPPSTSIRALDRMSGEIDEIAGPRDNPTMPVWSPDGSRYAYTAKDSLIVINDPARNSQSVSASEALSGEMTWSPDGSAILLSPWNAGSESTMVDLTSGQPVLSSIDIAFDASPPFLSPPQWSPAVAMPPGTNPSISSAEPAQEPAS